METVSAVPLKTRSIQSMPPNAAPIRPSPTPSPAKSPDLHKTIIALQTADLKFQLGLQVRNKLIGAYEEIMRMQV